MSLDMEKLVRLQDVMVELYQVREKLAKIPDQLNALSTASKKAAQAVEQAEEGLESRRVERRRLEGEVKGLESTVQKYREQLMSVKSNKEYQALSREIQTVQGMISDLETEILGHMEAIEAQEEALKELQAKSDQAASAEESRGGELQDALDQLKAQESKLTGQEKELAEGLPKNILSRFQRLAKSRQGVALSEAVQERCTQCHQRLRPQQWHEVRHTDKLIICDGCGRILYHAAPEGNGADAGSAG